MGSWDLLYYVLRANFDGVSSDYVKSAEDAGSAKYEYGCNVTKVSLEDNQTVVTYTDRDKKERKERPDLVFAADGPSSSIRGMLSPNTKRTYAGYVESLRMKTNEGCMARNSLREPSFICYERGFCRKIHILSC